MIAGEEMWLDQSLYTEQEYDEFFKKIRNKIKKKVQSIIPPKIFKPFGGITQLGSKNLLGKIRPRPKSSPQISPQVGQAIQFNEAKEVQIAEERKVLEEEKAAFEKKKVDDLTAIQEKEVKLEQAELDSKQGDNQQLMIYGGLGLLSVIVVLGLVARQSSKQSQLAALAGVETLNS